MASGTITLSYPDNLQSDNFHGFLEVIEVTRASSTTVDVDEDTGAQRKLVDLSASTDPATIVPTQEITDNTGAGRGSYSLIRIDGRVTLTATASCTVIIHWWT